MSDRMHREPDALDVLILAAGFGTRLRPLTKNCPKALLPLCGAPLLEHHLRRLLHTPGIGRVVINSHHLAEQVEDFVAGHPERARLALSPEPAILGTGGALACAAPLLSSDPFLVQNADTFFPFPLEALLAFHRAHGFAATMVLTRSAVWPNVLIEGERVARIVRGDRVAGALTFTGCHLFSRAALEWIPPSGYQDIRDAFDRLIALGELGAFVWPPEGEGSLLEIGTPPAYAEAQRICAGEGGRRFGLVAPDASAPIDARLTRFAERAMALLSGPRGGGTAADRTAKHEVGSALPETTPAQLVPLAGDGSTRRIYRVRAGGLSAVAVENPLPSGRARPDENEGFVAVREYLERRGVRVPRLFAADLDAGHLLLEDLGDVRLYDRVREEGWLEAHEPHYRALLDHLVRMQAPGDPSFRMALVPNPPYTQGFVLACEARYFHDELVRGAAGLEQPFDEVAGECRALAAAAFAPAGAGLPPDADRQAWSELTHAEAMLGGLTFVHRDYQSRNVMLVAGETAVIDFQGARWGPAEYDLASLLFDPYVAMPQQAREGMIDFYCERAAGAGVPAIPPRPDGAWRARLCANAANRLMQALGAYAKLGVRLGRPGFREHIPAGLRLLAGCLQERRDCPRLSALVEEVTERWR